MPGVPVCNGCGQMITGAGYQYQGQPYHVACYDRLIALHCAYCHKPLVGHYIIDSWGTTSCPEHHTLYPSCQFCGRLVPPQQQAIDGYNTTFRRCHVCRASAIETSAQAYPLFAQLVRWFHSQGLACNNLSLRIDLTDPTQLRQWEGLSISPHMLGVTSRQMLKFPGGAVQASVGGVAILRGLPLTLFERVVIHELGHVWLTVYNVVSLQDWAEEGFCELLAHRFLSSRATPESRFYAINIEQNTDPIYGEGFRRLHRIEQVVGFQALITALKSTKQLPSSA